MKKFTLSICVFFFLTNYSFGQCPINITTTDITCNSSNGTIDIIMSGTAPYDIIINGIAYNATNNFFSLSNLNPGSYQITVTDAVGCVENATASILAPPAPIIDGSIETDCNQEVCVTLTITGGLPPYFVEWNNGEFNLPTTCDQISNDEVVIFVTDANSCVSVITLVVPQGLNATINVTDYNCDNATFTADYSGNPDITPPITFEWSDASTDQDLFVDAFGTYSVTISDAANCQSTRSIDFFPIEYNGMVSTDVSCFGNNDGGIGGQVSGGFAPYTYDWNDPSMPDIPNLNGLAAGTYELTITDSGGCTAVFGPYFINEPDAMMINGITIVEPTCAGFADGVITIDAVAGGVGNYSYEWDFGFIGSSIVGIPAGIYNVTITDQNGCTITESITLQEGVDLELEITGTAVSCLSEGTAMVTVTGGSGSYTYVWSNGQTTPMATDLVAGTHSVTVTDGGNCFKEGSIFIDSPISLEVSSTFTDCDVENGTATVTIFGGATDPSYLWSNGQTAATAIDLAPGGYSVTVTDGITNCEVHRNVIVEQDPSCYVIISGYVLVDDVDQDCVEDAATESANVIRVTLSDGQVIFTNSDGYYEFQADAGTYEVSIFFNSNYDELCIDPLTVEALDWMTTYEDNNFYLIFGEDVDVELKVNKPNARPGFNQLVRICVMNRGAFPVSGTLTFIHPEVQEYIQTDIMETSYDMATRTLTYDYVDIPPGTIKVYRVTLYTPVGTALGTNLDYYFNAPQPGDITPLNNEIACSEEVTGSYDPNDKAVVPEGIGPTGIISMEDTTLSYRIRFQNTGTDTAFTVVLRDTLSDHLDLSTLEPGASSHDYIARLVRDNILEITFDNILLPDSFVNEPASNGFFIFDIDIKSGSDYGTVIENSAGIYFDFNEPVITNTVVNTIQMITAIPEAVKNNIELKVFPNPINKSGILEFNLAQMENIEIAIYDLLGEKVKIIETGKKLNAGIHKYALEQMNLSSGVYFVNVKTDTGQGSVRMVKL